MRISTFLLFTLLFTGPALWAQDSPLRWSADRSKWIPPGTDSLLIDSLPVLESSLQLFNPRDSQYVTNYQVRGKTFRYILFPQAPADSLLLRYQILKLPLNQALSHKDSSLILPELTSFPTPTYRLEENSFKPFEGLDSRGSISRGISVGNNQDAVLNSNLDLQLSGKIGANTELRASINDNNLPVQSDGYTQELREFDRVYIELENPSFGMLRAGDYNMSSLDNYFLKFDKRISGAGIFSKLSAGEGEIPLEIQGGIARGRFARNRFQGGEGNQGPYKLRGNNGENFIIIISGSERVYLDGILMQRGQNNDYVMDYNAGEISFTVLRPITKESRIVVEFQYTELNYLRSVAYARSGFQNENFGIRAHFYSEQDNRNQSFRQDLSDEEKQLLSESGDRLDQARVPAIQASPFRDDLVLYELRDSLGTDSILVYSVDSNKTLYQASFTFVGEQKGNYVLSRNNANGRVFQWVPPVNGLPQGNYEAVKLLSAPNKLQILSLEAAVKLGENQNLLLDMAVSRNDLNLFSELDEQNDIGSAGKFQYDIKGNWREAQWNTQLRYEYNQQNFRTVERIRSIEFARDWNLPLNYNGAVQLAGASFGLREDDKKGLYSIEHLNFEGYRGLRQSVAGMLNNKLYRGNVALSWLSSADSLGQSDFLREKFELIHFLTPRFWLGGRSIGELNSLKRSGQDSLSRSSYNFLEYQFLMGTGDTTGSFAEWYFKQRWDDTAFGGQYVNHSLVNTYGMRAAYNSNFNSRFEFFGNLRRLKVFFPEERELENTINSRINYLQSFFRNAISSVTFFETAAGTEARRTFSYVEVPAGTGQYTHTDYNNNGIKELDEFEIAPTPDLATYLRVFTPTNEYVRAGINKFSETLNIRSPDAWRQGAGFKKSLSYFSLLFNYQLDRKTLLSREGEGNFLNPFRETADSLIVALGETFRSTVFFNRSSPVWGLEYTYQLNDNHNLLSFGIEERRIRENILNARYRLWENLLVKHGITASEKVNSSANFSRRNYRISGLESPHSLAYQLSQKFLLSFNYQWGNFRGIAEDELFLDQQSLGVEGNYNYSEKISGLAQLTYIANDFTGNSNNPAAFELLRALKPGNNLTWMLNLQRNIRSNIVLSINYSGRVSEGGQPIHNGNLQVKAFF